jgi:hypothetical protein
VKDDSSDHIMCAFPFVWYPGFMVVTPPFTHLSITLSKQRLSNCSPAVLQLFIHIKKAYYSVRREVLYDILIESGVLM